MSLQTGKCVHARKWNTLPINQEVIEKVATLAKSESQPFLPGNVPIFEWAPGLEIDAIEEDDVKDMINDVDVQANILPPEPISNIVSEDENDDPADFHEDDESTISPSLPDEIPETIIGQNGDEDETHDSASGCMDDVADADHTVDSDKYDFNMNNLDVSAVDENSNDDEPEHMVIFVTQDDTPEEPTFFSEDESEANGPDDVPTPQSLSKLPKRVNTGEGVERLRVGHGGKTYEEIQQHKHFFMMQQDEKKTREDNISRRYLQPASGWR